MAKADAVGKALTRLVGEISLNRPFAGTHEAAFLSLVWSWQRLEQAGRAFFPRFGITDTQFNVLMILDDYRGRALRQHELAEILVVNRASAGSVLERMERNGWIERTPDPADRRAMQVAISRGGKAKLAEVRAPYYRLLAEIFKGESDADLGAVILFCDRMRKRLDGVEAAARRHAR